MMRGNDGVLGIYIFPFCDVLVSFYIDDLLLLYNIIVHPFMT